MIKTNVAFLESRLFSS